MKFFIILFKVFMNFIYSILKLFKTQNKVTFISRQTKKPSIDFIMLADELAKENKNIEIVMLNKEIDNGIIKKIQYFFHMFVQMYHIATSKVIILDGYCILISILKHKKNLKVVQIWHALGSLKKFGYSTLNKKDGRGEKVANLMDMHKNYTYILTSSKVSKPFFKEAFNANDNQMLVMSLPRVDFLLSKECEKEQKEKFNSIYKETLNNKPNILYCPTHRKNKELNIEPIVKATNFDKYNLIIKLHDGQEYIYVNNEKISRGEFFTGMDLLHVADYIITDYSAIVYEAAITNKPIYFYAFDLEEYMDDRGWYIDYEKEMPGPILKNIEDIMKIIEKDSFDNKKIIEFAKKYIEDLSGKASNKLAKFIVEIL